MPHSNLHRCDRRPNHRLHRHRSPCLQATLRRPPARPCRRAMSECRACRLLWMPCRTRQPSISTSCRRARRTSSTPACTSCMISYCRGRPMHRAPGRSSTRIRAGEPSLSVSRPTSCCVDSTSRVGSPPATRRAHAPAAAGECTIWGRCVWKTVESTGIERSIRRRSARERWREGSRRSPGLRRSKAIRWVVSWDLEAATKATIPITTLQCRPIRRHQTRGQRIRSMMCFLGRAVGFQQMSALTSR